MSSIQILLVIFLLSQHAVAQEKVAVGFWNVENLYDTLNDPLKDDDEFTPEGKNRWTSDKYKTKLANLSRVIKVIGVDTGIRGLTLLGLCEVENGAVLSDLLESLAHRQSAYEFVHAESEDVRGIDVALLYNPSYFVVDHFKPFPVVLPDTGQKTRHILLVTGKLKGEPFTVLVNHWPSRRGGEYASRPRRLAAAKVAARISDSLMKSEPGTNLLLMGDFNDDPVSYSIAKILKASASPDSGPLYNPYLDLFRKGIGTLAFNDRWNLFDQLLLTRNMLDGQGWQFLSAHVFGPDFLRSQKGNYKDYPFRTFSGGVYTGGYSDHFPSYVILGRTAIKE